MNMKLNSLLLSAAVSLTFAAFGGCTDSAPSGPAASLGNTTVTKYISIGNSLTSGYQSNGLYQSAQVYSYPNLIAQQLIAAGAPLGTFEQPLWSDPGVPDPLTGMAQRYEILNLVGPVIGPRGSAPGSPINMTLPRPYDNLGIPGIVIASFMDTTNIAKAGLAPYVLRYDAQYGGFPKSVYGHVQLLASKAATKPDLVTFWLGNNDVLGFATSGGYSPSAPTPASAFQALYAQALGALKTLLPNAKIMVATIPDVRAIPFFSTVGPKIAPSLAAAHVPLAYQKHGETGVGTGSTMLDQPNDVMITLTGMTYAGLLGKPNGQWYKDKKYPGLPPGIDTTKAFGFDPRNPWPDALVLDVAEQATAGNAVAAFNATIVSVGTANGAAIVDINKFFNDIKANGISYAGAKYTADFLSGGLFSLDGVHPSSKGAGVVANEFIRVMNASFGMNVSYYDISKAPGIPAPLAKYSNSAALPTISFESMRSLISVMGGKL
jgi:lysophospholipase L1-like esterase